MIAILDLQQLRYNKVISNGRLYIGYAGENPVDFPRSVYLDYAGTVLVSTPLALDVNGQIVYEGQVYSTCYVDYSYSMQVINSENIELFTPQFISVDNTSERGLTVIEVSATTHTLSDVYVGHSLSYTNVAGCTITFPAGLGAGFNCILDNATGTTLSVVGDGTSTVTNKDAEYTISIDGVASILPTLDANVCKLIGQTE